MGHKFAEIAFTANVRQVQTELGSRAGYAKLEGGLERNRQFGEPEADFIARRDSFYMATVGETGWPYVQHRGGPPGFLRVVGPTTIGFADFRGNRQYVSVGNLAANDRVSLFLMDYPNRARLKILGRARIVGAGEPVVLDQLAMPEHRAAIERGILIDVEAFDWNCSQHITQRYWQSEVETVVASLLRRIAALETRLERTE